MNFFQATEHTLGKQARPKENRGLYQHVTQYTLASLPNHILKTARPTACDGVQMFLEVLISILLFGYIYCLKTRLSFCSYHSLATHFFVITIEGKRSLADLLVTPCLGTKAYLKLHSFIHPQSTHYKNHNSNHMKSLKTKFWQSHALLISTLCANPLGFKTRPHQEAIFFPMYKKSTGIESSQFLLHP